MKASRANHPDPDNNLPLPIPTHDIQIGHAANEAATRHRFADYRSRRADHTLRRQDADLALFAEFLSSLGIQVSNLSQNPEAWRGITWGLVEAFVKWQLSVGYAIPSINVRLSTVKTYARLALQSGCLTPEEYALIRSIKGFSHREQQRLDQRRPRQRVGTKKPAPVTLTPQQAAALKTQPDTPQGRRDALLMCLLLDHGLRVGEVASLRVENIDLEAGLLRFFRPKVGKTQTHRLSPDTLHLLRRCSALKDLPAEPQAPLLRASLKDGSLSKAGMTTRAITQRVRFLGERLGIIGLSAHDCRHYWATQAARRGVDPFALQQAGGWASLAMPRRYIADNEIANEDLLDLE
ncbi:site-specific integrase [Thermanaerothrix sp. 4228-RoL]|jgi:integrase|uniref:Site-specific integrase n=1 Tax=Thermanaerothrix solaris TaxID=3058434 RepID=A0ABU3NJW6_9CHLR|nr:site-specific integrase [Thermanaerothrix sp. 4228-RoL]MDT8897148.1 site-specific integrase [Thermanaerothrix sp. 4228-RoL]